MDVKAREAEDTLTYEIVLDKDIQDDQEVAEILRIMLRGLNGKRIEVIRVSPEQLEPVGPENMRDLWITDDVLMEFAHKHDVRRSSISAAVGALAQAAWIAQHVTPSRPLVPELLRLKVRDQTSPNHPILDASSLVWFMEQTMARKQLIKARVHYGPRADANCERLSRNLTNQSTVSKAIPLFE